MGAASASVQGSSTGCLAPRQLLPYLLPVSSYCGSTERTRFALM